MHGCSGGEGCFNVITADVTPPPGQPIPDVRHGTSFLMAVELTDDGPQGVGLLAYGQSGDARSPHHVDGTEAYAAKALRPLLFTDAAIDADPELVRRTISG